MKLLHFYIVFLHISKIWWKFLLLELFNTSTIFLKKNILLIHCSAIMSYPIIQCRAILYRRVYIYIYIYIYIYECVRVCIYQPQVATRSQCLRRVQQVWIQSFPPPRLVATSRQKSSVCPTILPIAEERIVGFIPFPRVLVLC